ncbi:hypothetical protein [Acinetobacter johnsonii]|uniref:Uncharacterized protein n=1 Tax=Acinetobacter johnsonii TaxID=40214 RepID=A0A380TUG6_ACIJO|nr:hypothetical protein [Acinetobacter johnsonii]ENU40359.1 hypothetical protein F986_00872 [Acinetobacter johnsonii CIP 64.6]QPS02628.1 hypothetical protein I6G67_10230 [Acinetobacter johnsonii]SUT92223.1 Uncharacterised protein [Acinetobacter johnsonii]
MSKSSIKSKLVMAQAKAAWMDSGASSATIVFYEGAQPTTPETGADSNKALVTCTFPEPCFKEVTASYVELHPTNTATVMKTGTATWARIYNGEGEVVDDLAVGTDITLANTNLVLGGTLGVQSFKIRP